MGATIGTQRTADVCDRDEVVNNRHRGRHFVLFEGGVRTLWQSDYMIGPPGYRLHMPQVMITTLIYIIGK